MASHKEYRDFILDQLSGLEGITCRPMMGEYILYCHQKIFGGIYDDRLLVKPVAAAVRYMPDAVSELPYEGAREMLLVDCVDNREYLEGLIRAMEPELPAPAARRRRRIDTDEKGTEHI